MMITSGKVAFTLYAAAALISGCAATSEGRKLTASTEIENQIGAPIDLAKIEVRAVETPSLSENERLDMADSALAAGEAQTALALYQALPSGPKALAGLALARQALQQSGDIEVELNAALENNMSDQRLWNALGRFYDGTARYLEAQDAYISAMKAGAPAASAINNMGMSLLYEGRYDEAVDKFNQAKALAPDEPVFDNNQRLILALRGDYEGAVLNLSDSRGARLYNDAGYLAMRRGEIDRARTLLMRAIKLSPVYFAQAHSNLDALKARSQKS